MNLQNFTYKKTPLIRKRLIRIDALQMLFDTIPRLPHIEENLKRESLLKSSVYSARIEGNPLTTKNYKNNTNTDNDIAKLEIRNLLKTYKHIQTIKSKKITVSLIKKIHKSVMANVSSFAGRYRLEPWGIFDQSGNAVYLAPPFTKVPELMRSFVNYVNNNHEPIPIKAAIAEYIFEKIHPFADGNGRAGRVISAMILQTGGYGFKNLVAHEEQVEADRAIYYRALEENKDMTIFIEFYLLSLIRQAKKVLAKLQNKTKELPEDRLLPRRREILEIIRDHKLCSFDLIRRRFLQVNEKTLHYDVSQLLKHKFIVKVGGTRGALYRISNS